MKNLNRNTALGKDNIKMSENTNISLINTLAEFNRHRRELTTVYKDGKVGSGRKFEAEFGLFLDSLKPISLSTKPFLVKLRNGRNYQIDVLADFPDAIIIVECKEGEGHNINRDLSYISDNKSQVTSIIRELIPKSNKSKVCALIIAFSDQIPSTKDFKQARSSGITLLDRKIFNAYDDLAKKLKSNQNQVGVSARDIIFSDWLKGKSIRSLPKSEKNISATKGKFGKLECYSFMASPYLLKKLCYVHRRHIQHTLSEGDISYQRLIKPQKIKQIAEFLSQEKQENFFPTSVLINFEKGVEFHESETKKSEMKFSNPNVITGWLKPKKKYGCAIIIDGQHRIFGYSGLDELSKEHSLNVIAFSELDPNAQAKLFADINENQTPIHKNDLWDLYTDILPEDSPKFKTSAIAKKLNKKSEFFKDKIYIPSISKKRKKDYPLNMNAVCVDLFKKAPNVFNKLLEKNDDMYYFFIDKIFSKKLLQDDELHKDWEHSERSFILSKNGLETLFIVLNYFFEFLLKSEVDVRHISKSKTELSRYIDQFSDPVIKSIKSIGLEYFREGIKSSSGGAKGKIRDKILIEAGKYSDTFKKISNKIYLQGLKEDMNTELKSTLYFDRKNQKYSNDYLNNAILGTITAFITRNVEGNLFVGVSDAGKMEGLDNELAEKFKNNTDEMIKFINDKITSNLIAKEYSKSLIDVKIYSEEPLVLKIHVPKGNGVALVREDKRKYSIYVKTSSGKRKIEPKNLPAELDKDKAGMLNSLIISHFT